jgi:hypothetical protein
VLRAGGVAQDVECLPSKCEALSSNPSAKKDYQKPSFWLSEKWKRKPCITNLLNTTLFWESQILLIIFWENIIQTSHLPI